MARSIIIGSGPAAAGVALALARDSSQSIIVVDIGQTLESELRTVVDRLATREPAEWDPEDIAAVQRQPVNVGARGLPQKRTYGSDYPFRDVGQLTDIDGSGNVNQAIISGAYGGLTNVWGSQVMPFTSKTFSKWPISFETMAGHYREILREIPFSAEEDALARHFPLLAAAEPLPALAPRTSEVLRSFSAARRRLEADGIVVGRARLAFKSAECRSCGLCMTGCPYGLVYSAAQTFDRLRREGRVEYHSGLLALRLDETEEGPSVTVRDGSGALHRLRADRIFVGCGSIGTTRLVLDSLGLYDRDLEVRESAQFVLPMVSKRGLGDPGRESTFTLNQFNLAAALDEDWIDVAHIHFYPHNPAVESALPRMVRSGMGRPLAHRLLRRLTIGLGYLPSWESPGFRVRVTPPTNGGGPAPIRLSGDQQALLANPMMRRVLRKLLRAAPALDLWPALPRAFLSAPGKSYHFGGTFPHRETAADGLLTTDRLGRLGYWNRIHLTDASVFPVIPATTFTLTIMANAHRIATEVRELSP